MAMKHQLYKKGKYVQINVGKSHLTIVGKVKDSTVLTKKIRAHGIFNIPQQAIELELKLLVIQENPEIAPVFHRDIRFLYEIVEKFDGLTIEFGKVYASVDDLEIPSQELKDLFYKFNQGAK